MLSKGTAHNCKVMYLVCVPKSNKTALTVGNVFRTGSTYGSEVHNLVLDVGVDVAEEAWVNARDDDSWDWRRIVGFRTSNGSVDPTLIDWRDQSGLPQGCAKERLLFSNDEIDSIPIATLLVKPMQKGEFAIPSVFDSLLALSGSFGHTNYTVQRARSRSAPHGREIRRS